MFFPNRINVELETYLFLAEEKYFYIFSKLYFFKIYLSDNDIIILHNTQDSIIL